MLFGEGQTREIVIFQIIVSSKWTLVLAGFNVLTLLFCLVLYRMIGYW